MKLSEMTREQLMEEVVRLSGVLQTRDTQLTAERKRNLNLESDNQKLRRDLFKPTSHVRGWP